MTELRDLYQQLILDHNQHPRNFGVLEGADLMARGNNPLCGDQLDLYVALEDDSIKDIRFEGSGCAIFKSSTSIMTTVVKGKTRGEAMEIFERFHRLATTGEVDAAEMGKLAALASVYKYPVRVKCALLAWRTLETALQEQGEIVSTE